MKLIKKIFKNIIKYMLIMLLFFSSGLALYINSIGDFDPVELAIKLKNEKNRDQAIDVIDHSLEYGIGNQNELKELKKKYEYGVLEKSKDIIYYGAVKGNVFNFYSGLGCVGADLCVVGDIRDLVKQGYHYMTDKEIDLLVTALSAIGVGTTIAELSGAGLVVDAGVSATKTTVKYSSKVLKKIPESLLKTVKKGKSLKPELYVKLWHLFKATKFSIPNFTTLLLKIKNVKYLDSAIDIVKAAKTGAVIFIEKSGEAGIKVYEYFRKKGLGKRFAECIKKNPKAALGITKFHKWIHGIKIFKKQGPIILPLIFIYGLASILLMISGPWLPILILLSLSIYIVWRAKRFKTREKREDKNSLPQMSAKMEPQQV